MSNMTILKETIDLSTMVEWKSKLKWMAARGCPQQYLWRYWWSALSEIYDSGRLYAITYLVGSILYYHLDHQVNLAVASCDWSLHMRYYRVAPLQLLLLLLRAFYQFGKVCLAVSLLHWLLALRWMCCHNPVRAAEKRVMLPMLSLILTFSSLWRPESI